MDELVKRRRRAALAAGVLVLIAFVVLAFSVGLLTGGGNDKADAERTVREFIKATNDRDADKFCGELVTQDFLEQTTGAIGDQAQEQCTSQLKSIKGVDLHLVRIKKTTVNDDHATVRATIAAQGEAKDQMLRLEKEDGRFKLAGGAGG